MRLIIYLSKIYMCVCNFYLNKLFIFLKEIILIIKIHIKLILNMYNLFSKFYCRERERDYSWCGTKKIQLQNVWTQNRVLKITIIHQNKVELQKRIFLKKRKKRRENNYFFSREMWERIRLCVYLWLGAIQRLSSVTLTLNFIRSSYALVYYRQWHKHGSSHIHYWRDH